MELVWSRLPSIAIIELTLSQYGHIMLRDCDPLCPRFALLGKTFNT